MYPAEFSVMVPRTLDEALQLLSRHEDAKVLAGGQSLIPLMKLRVLTPKHIIYLGKIQDLSYIRTQGDRLLIGAMTTHAEVASSDAVRKGNPLLSEVASRIGDLQVRNMGTIGGSLAHADPAADYPAAILALEGEVVARSSRGSRVIKAHEFFRDAYTTDLRRDELITEVRVPILGKDVGAAYEKLVFRATDFAGIGG
jgi:carbon-monoxide dehydrogenase medium subunit